MAYSGVQKLYVYGICLLGVRVEEEGRKDLEAKILGWKDNLLKERGGEG